MLVIGIGGFDGVGKTTFRNALVDYLVTVEGMGIVRGCSVSDAIGHWLAFDQGYGLAVLQRPLKPETRALYINRGMEMKKIHGDSYWINKTVEQNSDADVLIVDGIRFPCELGILNFLIFITQSQESAIHNLGSVGDRVYGKHMETIEKRADLILPMFPSRDKMLFEMIAEKIGRLGN
jgi:hypothetical protein